MSHTPEPWRIKCHTCASPAEIDEGDDYTIQGEDGTPVAFEPCMADPNRGADARRIVACVNACRGMTNEQLDSIRLISGSLLNRFGEQMHLLGQAEKQRDELLAAMEKISALRGSEHGTVGMMLAAAMQIADKAIAGMKGGA